MSIVQKMNELANEAAIRNLRPTRMELSEANYAEIKKYIAERTGWWGSDIAEELGRNDPQSPYFGGKSREEKLRDASVRWNFDGIGEVPIVEALDLIGGPILYCRTGERIAPR